MLKLKKGYIMALSDEIAEIEVGLKLAKVKKSELFKEADISFVTWSRWKKGDVGPLKSSWDAVTAAYAKLTRNR